MPRWLSKPNRCVDSRAAGVIMTAAGYPGDYPKGSAIRLGQDMADTKVFHAGTTMNHDQPVVIRWPSALRDCTRIRVREAQAKAYERLKTIEFEGAEHRTDIGYRAVERETLNPRTGSTPAN